MASITSIIEISLGFRARYTPPFRPRRDFTIPDGFNFDKIWERYAAGQFKGLAKAAAEIVAPSGCFAKAITADIAYWDPCDNNFMQKWININPIIHLVV